MEHEIFEKMAAVEDRHRWFVSRRAIVSNLIDRLHLPADATILEGGSGTGGKILCACVTRLK